MLLDVKKDVMEGKEIMLHWFTTGNIHSRTVEQMQNCLQNECIHFQQEDVRRSATHYVADAGKK